MTLLPITLRPATDADEPALVRLAQRDSRPRPAGPLLVAEREGSIDAAVSLTTGEAIADPFKPTADLVELLRRQAAAVGAHAPRGLAARRGRAVAARPVLAGGCP